MGSKLKRDQLPPEKAANWRKNMKEEEKLSFNLKVPHIVLKKETYKILAGENENRVRVYLGLEAETEKDKLELCAYAVSAFLLGSGDVYVDYETPVYKVGKENIDFSSKTVQVIESIKRYRDWRAGKIDNNNAFAAMRQFIYPNAYLFTKFELHEIFNVQNKSEAQIEFGISKTMNAMINPTVIETRALDDDSDTFDFADICPPYCDERSIYNPS